MAQNAVPDTSAGDPTPELTQASLIKAVTLLNKYGFNIEIPNTGTAGPINIKRAVNISGTVAIPASSGMVLNVSQSVLRATILQQTVGTDDERTYLLNNASPPAGAFSNNMLYDKTGAGASYYMQRAGAHTFATAPIGTADQVATFTSRVKIDVNGLSVLAGAISVLNSSTGAAAFVSGSSSGNLSAFTIAGVAVAGEYITGSAAADTAFRANQGNLVLGAFAGNTTIGTATKTIARFGTDGKVIIPGANAINSNYADFSVGGGMAILVGGGSDVAATAKSYWVYNSVATVGTCSGFGWQLNANLGATLFVGNGSNSWNRAMIADTVGRVGFGGTASAGADVHITNAGTLNSSGSLSLTAQGTGGGASYLLMGNADSQGTAGPSMIVGANRNTQIGVGTSFTTRGGGAFTPILTVEGSSSAVGVQISNPGTYGPFAVNVTNTSAIAQVFLALNSPSTLGAAGTLAGGFGVYWGNNLFVGSRVVTGGDGNNAGLALMVAKAGSSVEGARVDLNSNLTVRGDTFMLGTNSVNVLGCDSGNNLYVRGSSIVLQNPAANANYLQASSSLVSIIPDAQFNSNAVVNGALTTNRQIEKTGDKSIGNSATFDYTTTSLWMCTGATSNFTANFTNVPTAANQAITVSLILMQGPTAYYPLTVQINGTTVPLWWAGGVQPVPTPSKIDMFQFSLIRTSSNTWTVLASATPFVL